MSPQILSTSKTLLSLHWLTPSLLSPIVYCRHGDSHSTSVCQSCRIVMCVTLERHQSRIKCDRAVQTVVTFKKIGYLSDWVAHLEVAWSRFENIRIDATCTVHTVLNKADSGQSWAPKNRFTFDGSVNVAKECILSWLHLESLYGCKVNLRPSLGSWTFWIRFLLPTALYFSPFSLSSALSSFCLPMLPQTSHCWSAAVTVDLLKRVEYLSDFLTKQNLKTFSIRKLIWHLKEKWDFYSCLVSPSLSGFIWLQS